MLTSGSGTLPLVGRNTDLTALRDALANAKAGRGSTSIVYGESGIGKTRLVTTLAEMAAREGWSVAVGRAYPIEAGVPYACVADAMLPLLRSIDTASLTALTRGGTAELAYLFPALSASLPSAGGPRAALRDALTDSPAEVKSRLLWNFAQFLGRFAAKQPLLIILENLQWADASSLELLHFTARQIGRDRVLIVCTYNEMERDLNPGLKPFVTSLAPLGVATMQHIEPLPPSAIDELLSRAFGVGPAARREFAALLYGWTRGNPFFIEETLKALIGSRRLYQRGGEWFGWEISNLGLPRSIRDAVAARLAQLSPEGRKLAEFMAVIGTRSGYDTLRVLYDANDTDLLALLDELRHNAIVAESEESGEAVFDFTHPILRDTLYAELGVARSKVLHGAIAEGLERVYGVRAPEHADQLAYHYVRADARRLVPKALAYLTRAGRHALAQYANREAADYLTAALEQSERLRDQPGAVSDNALVEDLAQARHRLGEYDAAQSLWENALHVAQAANDGAGDLARIADIERHAGLAAHWAGRHEAALAHYDVGLDAALRAGEPMRTAKLRLAKAACFHVLGNTAAADREIDAAELLARDAGDDALLARVYRAQLLTHLWTGSPDHALAEGLRVLELATQTRERYLAFTAHWALAMVSGLTGDSKNLEHHLVEGERLADQLRSPVLGLWIAEIVIQFRFGIGRWDEAIAEGERAIALARLLGQRVMVPRLLVWTAVVYMARGDVAKAQAYAAEAWSLGGPSEDSRDRDVHSLLAVHMGRAYCHLGADEFEEALRISEAGLELADRVGYVVWAIYQLAPIAAEACLRLTASGDAELYIARAEAFTARLRSDSSRSGQRLGLAWADAADGVVARLRGDHRRAIELLTRSIDALEAVPYVHDGARMRRELAVSLEAVGEREAAREELSRIYAIFSAIGAKRDVDITREDIRALGGRVPAAARDRASKPARVSGAEHRGDGERDVAESLSAREAEIAQLVAARRSNKEIARLLGISPRTVSTHLSNIFGKVGAESRGELADLVRHLPAAATPRS